jgi:hypothetical protein
MSKFKLIFIFILAGLIFPYFSLAIVAPTVTTNIYDFFQRIFRILLTISIPIAVIVILWAAFSFLTSGGEPEKTQKAKKVLTYALIGFGIILLSNGIVYTLGDVFGIRVTAYLPAELPGEPTGEVRTEGVLFEVEDLSLVSEEEVPPPPE